MEGADTAINIMVGTIRAGTPLVFAALGELISEKAGVLNLGVEGMMLVGAVTGFIVTVLTGNPYLGVLAAIAAGTLMSVIFGGLTQVLLTNQVATGLALTIFGVGLSAFVGLGYIGTPITGLQPVANPGPQPDPGTRTFAVQSRSADLSVDHHVRIWSRGSCSTLAVA